MTQDSNHPPASPMLRKARVLVLVVSCFVLAGLVATGEFLLAPAALGFLAGAAIMALAAIGLRFKTPWLLVPGTLVGSVLLSLARESNTQQAAVVYGHYFGALFAGAALTAILNSRFVHGTSRRNEA